MDLSELEQAVTISLFFSLVIATYVICFSHMPFWSSFWEESKLTEVPKLQWIGILIFISLFLSERFFSTTFEVLDTL